MKTRRAGLCIALLMLASCACDGGEVQGLSMQVEELERRLNDPKWASTDIPGPYDDTNSDDDADGSGCTERNN